MENEEWFGYSDEIKTWTDEELQEFYDAWKIGGWYHCCDEPECADHECDDLGVCLEIEWRWMESEFKIHAD